MTRTLVVLEKELRHHCSHDSHCERLELPFSSHDILSGYEDLVSSGSDHFTMWGKMSPREILAEHVVDIHKVVADFRDAFERNQFSSSQSYGVTKYFSGSALAHVACAPQESVILLTDFAAAYPSVNHSWIFSEIEKTELPDFIGRSYEVFLTTALHTWNSREQPGDNSLWPGV